MTRLNRIFTFISLLMITALLLAACAPAATPTPAEPAEPEAEVTEAPAAEEGFTVGIFLPDKKTMRYDTKDRPIFTENFM